MGVTRQRVGVGLWVVTAFTVAGGCGSAKRDFGGSGGSAGDDAAGNAGRGGGVSKAGSSASGGMSDSEGGAAGASGEPNIEACTPGESKSCYESMVGVAYVGTPAADQKTCHLGARKCQEGATWGVCVGAVAPDAADSCEPGNDANCNGKPNEGCACKNGDTRPCGSAVGSCKEGKQSCANQIWGACEGEVKPAAIDTCLAATEANDMNCNGQSGDGCACLATDAPRCNPGAADVKQTCSNAGQWVTAMGGAACPAGTVCRDNGASCKVADGQKCNSSSDCANSNCTAFYLDADKDGYRANGTVVSFCGASKPGYVAKNASRGDDCADNDGDINPGAIEACDGIDNNCDGDIDIAGNGALQLSGSQKSIGSGTESNVGSSNGNYGVVFSDDKTYFETIDQSNNVQVQKAELDPGNSSAPSIAWDGSSFDIFYHLNGNDLRFKKATTSGVSAAPFVSVGTPSSASASSVVYMPNQNWFYSAFGGGFGASWGYVLGFDGVNTSMDGTSIPSTAALTPPGFSYSSVAVSGTTFGAVYHAAGGSGNDAGTLEFSARNSSWNETNHKQLRTSSPSNGTAIAARAGGGFSVIWGDGTALLFEEISTSGATICGPIYKPLANFNPDQMVLTKRGYLAVTGAAGVVKAQEIIAGCTWGTTFSNIGTGSETTRAHIAAGPNGFAVVWDERSGSAIAKNIYSRTFGPDLCN